MAKHFLPFEPGQQILLPQDMRTWLPEGHLALFVMDVVAALDLSAIYARYGKKDSRGRAAHHPQMMVGLLVYGYCAGITSSRKIERATYEDVAFRVLAADQHPDHDSIASFRKEHLKGLSGLFMQVLKLCQKAGLVKLGHVAIDGTKMGANASKHKAMSYDRMTESEKKLKEEIDRLLEEAERIDREEDERYGKGRRGDELPAELARRESRLIKIQEAKAALEEEAKENARIKAEEVKTKIEEREKKEAETGKKIAGHPPVAPDPEQAKPQAKAQRNFTDPESRIMPDGANKGSFIQGYNSQIAVDSEVQIIVAFDVNQQTNDKRQLVPMAQKVVENVEQLPDTISADSGYFSEMAVSAPLLEKVELLIPPNRQKHGEEDALEMTTEPTSATDSAKGRMKEKLQTERGSKLYKQRKAIVEPVFGQIKAVRGIRRFSLRGLESVHCEFSFIALTHNLLKLFRHGSLFKMQTAAI